MDSPKEFSGSIQSNLTPAKTPACETTTPLQLFLVGVVLPPETRRELVVRRKFAALFTGRLNSIYG
jgi:hypothetical protein